jgi:hypothetical protein
MVIIARYFHKVLIFVIFMGGFDKKKTTLTFQIYSEKLSKPNLIGTRFVPGFVNYKKGCTRLAAASDKVYQLLAHGRWFSPGTAASSTTKTGRHDITEILLKVALKHQKSFQWNQLLCSQLTGVWFIQVKITKISYFGTLFKVQSVLLRYMNSDYLFGIFKLFLYRISVYSEFSLNSFYCIFWYIM